MNIQNRILRLESRLPPIHTEENVVIDLEKYSEAEQAIFRAVGELFRKYRDRCRTISEFVSILSEVEEDLILRCDRLIRFGTGQ